MIGAAFLVAPALLWLAVAARLVGWRSAGRAFGFGLLGFPLALLTQWLILRGHGPPDLPPLLGILAVLGLVGPSEEFWKAVLARPGRVGFATANEACAAGVACATGYTFAEHFFRFLDPSTPLYVMAVKATLGVSLHALVSTLWSGRMISVEGLLPASRWLRGVGAAGLVHGCYDAAAYLPIWTGCPLGAAVALQLAIVCGLAWRLGKRVGAPA